MTTKHTDQWRKLRSGQQLAARPLKLEEHEANKLFRFLWTDVLTSCLESPVFIMQLIHIAFCIFICFKWKKWVDSTLNWDISKRASAHASQRKRKREDTVLFALLSPAVAFPPDLILNKNLSLTSIKINSASSTEFTFSSPRYSYNTYASFACTRTFTYVATIRL
jgi:hypothetical protein